MGSVGTPIIRGPDVYPTTGPSTAATPSPVMSGQTVRSPVRDSALTHVEGGRVPGQPRLLRVMCCRILGAGRE